MKFRLARSAFALIMLLASSGAHVAVADTQIGGTANWTTVGVPIFTKIGISPVVETTFHNNLNVGVLGIVIMVVHNNQSQTVFYSTATLNLTRGFSGTAYNVELGLPPGRYQATIFAISTSGVGISNSTTLSISP